MYDVEVFKLRVSKNISDVVLNLLGNRYLD